MTKLLIVLSEASLQSEWVMTELPKARKAERQSGKRKFFPVRLVEFETLRDWQCFDAGSGKDRRPPTTLPYSPPPPRASSCENTSSRIFSRWTEHDHLEAAFSRLL